MSPNLVASEGIGQRRKSIRRAEVQLAVTVVQSCFVKVDNAKTIFVTAIRGQYVGLVETAVVEACLVNLGQGLENVVPNCFRRS